MPMQNMAPPGADESEMDSLYGGPAEGAESKPAAKGESEDEEKIESANTAIVPVNVLTGKGGAPLKEGDEVVLKVVKLYGDEAEVEYSTTKPGDIGGEEISADTEIDQMNEAGTGNY